MSAQTAHSTDKISRSVPRLTPLRDFDCVKADLHATTGDEAIRVLHEQLCRERTIREPALLLHDLLARHAVASSCLNDTVALPHARTLAVDEIFVAIGRSARGIRFSDEHPAIRLVIVVAAPASRVQEYLGCTFELVRRLRNPAIVRDLLKATTVDEVRAAWNELPALPVS